MPRFQCTQVTRDLGSGRVYNIAARPVERMNKMIGDRTEAYIFRIKFHMVF